MKFYFAGNQEVYFEEGNDYRVQGGIIIVLDAEGEEIGVVGLANFLFFEWSEEETTLLTTKAFR